VEDARAHDRLQASLFDLLTDLHPEKQEEGRLDRVHTAEALRQAVLRDLGHLFNASSVESPRALLGTAPHPKSGLMEFPSRCNDWASYPEVAHSVLCFGIPGLAGQVASELNFPRLESKIRQAVLDHEPRLVPHALRVCAEMDDMFSRVGNVVSLRIEGVIKVGKVALEVLLRTELDLETGQVQVKEYR
jgi:type VI secretion system protein ImpF